VSATDLTGSGSITTTDGEVVEIDTRDFDEVYKNLSSYEEMKEAFERDHAFVNPSKTLPKGAILHRDYYTNDTVLLGLDGVKEMYRGLQYVEKKPKMSMKKRSKLWKNVIIFIPDGCMMLNAVILPQW
jgi:hypothetical protein